MELKHTFEKVLQYPFQMDKFHEPTINHNAIPSFTINKLY